MTRAVTLAFAAWLSMCVTAIGQPDAPHDGRTTNDRVYSAEQARDGKTLFLDVCIACHADPFWKPGWQGKSLRELYTTILKYMPDDNPGTLSGREVVAALAYILQSNGAPSGSDPLPDDAVALGRIVVADPRVP